LLFFALISYTPKDVPSWIWFSHISPSNHPAQNFIGPVGAIVAGICYQCIGVFASLLLAAVLLGFGAAKLFHPRLRVTSRISWIVLFIISGACLDQLWDIFGEDRVLKAGASIPDDRGHRPRGSWR